MVSKMQYRMLRVALGVAVTAGWAATPAAAQLPAPHSTASTGPCGTAVDPAPARFKHVS